MAENEPILPALKPYDWNGREYALCRPLINAGELRAVPWLGFGYNRPNSFEFVSRESFPSGSTEDHIRLIEQAALRNLRERPLDWKVENVRLGRFVLGWFRRMKLLIGTGDFLAAEHLLDPIAMRQAGTLLKSRRILVGAPSRGVLVATKARQSKGNLARFSAMVSTQYYHSRVAPISPVVFIVEDGEIKGALPGSEQAGMEIQQPEDAGQPAGDQHGNSAVNEAPAVGDLKGVLLQAIITADRTTGKETLHLLAGDSDFDRLSQALTGAFAKGVGDMLSHPDFSGQVRIILVPELTPRTPDFDARLAHLQEHFRGIAEDLNLVETNGERAINPPLEVRVVYGQEQENSSSVLSKPRPEMQPGSALQDAPPAEDVPAADSLETDGSETKVSKDETDPPNA